MINIYLYRCKAYALIVITVDLLRKIRETLFKSVNFFETLPEFQ